MHTIWSHQTKLYVGAYNPPAIYLVYVPPVCPVYWTKNWTNKGRVFLVYRRMLGPICNRPPTPLPAWGYPLVF